jgi:DNA-binding NarL/FixJ family response regulator
MPDVRVALVDDHEMFRDGVRSVLGATPGFEVVLEAGDARTFVGLLDGGSAFDVALIDIAMPGQTGFTLVRELCRRELPQPAILLTMHLEPDMIEEGFVAGARGYLLKTQPAREVCHAIRQVLAGGRYLPPQLDETNLDRRLKRREESRSASPLATLSPRERDVFDLLITGLNSREIARHLFISVKTVETHREHILKKLDVHCVVELVRLAARHNLLAPTVEQPASSTG